jgi:hypothetical protein
MNKIVVVLLDYPVEVRCRMDLFLLCFACFAQAAQAGRTCFPLDWLNIAGSAIFPTRPGPSFARSRVQVPTVKGVSVSGDAI